MTSSREKKKEERLGGMLIASRRSPVPEDEGCDSPISGAGFFAPSLQSDPEERRKRQERPRFAKFAHSAITTERGKKNGRTCYRVKETKDTPLIKKNSSSASGKKRKGGRLPFTALAAFGCTGLSLNKKKRPISWGVDAG